MSKLTEQPIGSFKTKANRQWTEVACPLSRRSWGGTCDKPKNVCVGGYLKSDLYILLCLTPDDFTRQRETP